ncbi:MAG: glutamate synthase large subunit [Planctomycetaceae bacterium]
MLRPQKAQGLYDPANEHDSCGIGAVVNINGRREHAIIDYGRQILLNLHHRGAAGSDEVTGDGAGILMQVPREFLPKAAAAAGVALPRDNAWAVGMAFVSRDSGDSNAVWENIVAQGLAHYGLKVLGWRTVPADNSCLGQIARSSEPGVRQFFTDTAGLEGEALERKCFMARKRVERLTRERFGPDSEFYICSFSAQTLVYKGMFMAHQLFAYYPDLAEPAMTTALAIVHQRYSTNTFPSWTLAQPFRCLAHNGEINTLSGNRNHMRARETKMASPLLGDDLSDLLPVLAEGGSDSAQFDNVLEMLTRAGRPLPHAMMMMIPEAFGARYHISTDKRAFYEFHSAIMEPWDGPAAMVFTDGRVVGGTLDRNGLRPCRYVVTTDGLVVLASETGVIDFPPEKIQTKGRLQPGRMFLVDTQEGRIVTDNEIKSKIARSKPYRRWLDDNRIELRGLFDAAQGEPADMDQLVRAMKAFGYTREELRMVLTPMAVNAQEPIGSMGTDTPLAVLSNQPKSLFAYFKQLFAQVTNPPIDPLREGLVMSLMLYTGQRRNLLEETPEHCCQLKLPHPILTNEDMRRLRTVKRADFKVATIYAHFDADDADPAAALRRGLDDLINAAEEEIRLGASLLVISDRETTARRAPIPILLATSAVHQGLLRRKLRGEAGLIIESCEPREVAHFCLLCGYGANAINPHLAFEALNYMRHRGELGEDLEPVQIVDNYIAAIKKGILKTISKMGISTLRSYRSAQLFEAIGLARDVIETYFTGTASRIGGVGLGEIATETLRRHNKAYEPAAPAELPLEYGGEYHFRKDGEQHLWNPHSVSRLQHAVVADDAKAYDDYARAINDQSKGLCTLRGLFDFKGQSPIPLEDVEPAEEIVKRFCTGAMSHGSISKEAHECMAVAMNRLGAMSNTGEGGEDPKRYTPEPNGDSRNCAIKQVASARFGVTIDYLAHAREIQIKMAQGAKPGEGGHLPGHKVTDEIARLRHSTPGVSLISPPPHHDIYSIEDLAQLIYDLKCSNPGVKVSVKLVSEVGVGTIAAGVAKGNADEVLISGHDGGTGSSPLSSIKHAGCPWELGLAETQQTLVLNGLRDRIRVQADGQMKTGRDVVIAALLGAEQFGFGTAALVSMGCVLMRKCHLGTCPVGVATQDPALRSRFAGKPEHVQRYMMFVAHEVRRIMAELGVRKVEDLIGQTQYLDTRKALDHWKARGLDFSAIFAKPAVGPEVPLRLTRKQTDHLGDHLDWQIIAQAKPALENKQKVVIERPIRNVHRTVGTILSNRVNKAHGAAGLPEDTITCTFTGSAGQSFGAFLAPGITLKLIGDSNDYLGKGLSGGRIIVQTPAGSPFEPHRNIIVGNTLLYGATSGQAFINGMAGERFAVRNSGAVAVVEGLGDHGCEYMTGGRVVVLGQTGRNFAAGMSGGIAYVLDEHQLFDTLCNLDTVDLETVYLDEDVQLLKSLIERHQALTASRRAADLLANWEQVIGSFVKVMPLDYRKALERLKERQARGGEYEPATEEVYHG